MGFSYDKLWKKLIDEKMNKLDLQKAIQTTPHTIVKMGRDENVSMEILGRICKYFKCDISEILEYRMEEERCFLTQQGFAKEIKVAFSTVNRWKGGKAKPNFNAMKNIKEFCLEHDVDYAGVEEAWLDFKVRSKSK